MSSSQQPSKNNNNNNNNNHPNRFVDYGTDESPRYAQEQMSDNRGQSHENDFYEQMYSYQEGADEDLPNEYVAEVASNVNDEDESVFSDVVQDAFKKYQNEQEELLAQMEECWNYMSEETNYSEPPKSSVDPSSSAQLNPDATEFKPTWLQTSPSEASSNSSKGQEKRI